MRNSLDYANWKDRKPLAAAIKPIYTAPIETFIIHDITKA